MNATIPDTHPQLTPRQELFVAEYPRDWNGKEAAIRAGYSVRTAKQIACKLLRYPHIAVRVAEARNLLVQQAKQAREPVDIEPLIHLKRAAEILNIHPKSLGRMAAQGSLPAMKLGHAWKFRVSTLNRWLEEQMANRAYVPSGYDYKGAEAERIKKGKNRPTAAGAQTGFAGPVWGQPGTAI